MGIPLPLLLLTMPHTNPRAYIRCQEPVRMRSQRLQVCADVVAARVIVRAARSKP